MNRSELKEIIQRIVKQIQQERKDAPQPACLYGDNPTPGPTTKYAIGEEA